MLMFVGDFFGFEKNEKMWSFEVKAA